MLKIAILILLTPFIFSINVFGSDMNRRVLFVDKYKSDITISKSLEKILGTVRGGKVDINEVFASIDLISKSKSYFSAEVMVGLLDFYFGEAPRMSLKKEIVEKGMVAMPYLKDKFFDIIYKDEWPNENDEETIVKKRNSELAELLDHIYFNVPYAIEFDNLSPNELTEVKLFYFQKALRNYFWKNGRYPIGLTGLTSELFDADIITFNDGWNREYKYFCGIFHYFLQSNGGDGVFGTKDDILPPINSEVHCFPGKDNREKTTGSGPDN